MFERSISAEDVEAALSNGRIIENYTEDKPYPSFLWLGYSNQRPLHIVFADDQEQGRRIIITVYEPDPQQWESNFMIRKKG